jgi:hypothetical protein
MVIAAAGLGFVGAFDPHHAPFAASCRCVSRLLAGRRELYD